MGCKFKSLALWTRIFNRVLSDDRKSPLRFPLNIMKRIGIFDFWHKYRLCFSWSMASILSERFEVVYFTTKDFPEGEQKFELARLPIAWPEKTHIHTWLRLLHSCKASLKVRNMVRSFGLDLIYFAFNHPLLPFFYFRDVPLINTVHELDFRQGWTSVLNNASLYLTLSRCSAVTVMNPGYMDRFKAKSMKCFSFPHPPYSVPGAQERQTNFPIKFLFFGKIRHDKGLDLLLRAAKRVRDRGYRFGLTIAGNGRMKPYRGAVQPLGHGIQIINKFLEDRDVVDLLGAHDMAILPYRSVSQSGVATLCNSCALPMMVADLGGLLPNIHDGKTGLSFRQGDVKSLTNKMIDIIERPERIGTFREALAGRNHFDSMKIISIFNSILYGGS